MDGSLQKVALFLLFFKKISSLLLVLSGPNRANLGSRMHPFLHEDSSLQWMEEVIVVLVVVVVGGGS